MARQSRNQGRKGFSPQRHRAHKDFHKIFSFCELRLRGYIPSLSSPRFAQAARLLMRSSTKKRRQVEINRKECKGADLELRQLIFASFAFSAVKSHPRIPSRTIQCRAKLATQCSVRGSKPRRRADTGVHRAPTCSSLPRFAFRSMAPVTRVFAVRIKVQLYRPPFDPTQGGEHVEPRSKRLVSLNEIS